MNRKATQELNLMFFYRADRAGKKNNKSPLQCRVKVDNHHKDMSTGIDISPCQWDSENNELKENCNNFTELKREIDDFSDLMKSYFKVLCHEQETVTPIMLKNRYNGKPIDYDAKTGSREEHTLIRIFEEKIADFTKSVNAAKERAADREPPKKSKKGSSKYTLTQWKATLNKVIEYLTYLKTGYIPITDKREFKTEEQKQAYIQEGKAYDIPVETITFDFAADFISYLTEIRHNTLGVAAAGKQVKNTKHVLKMAVGKGWITRNPLEDYKCADEIIDVIPLEYYQIDQLYEKTGLINRLERVRDGYIGQIFSGFAWQDIRALRPENIIYDENGNAFLSKKRGKTDEYEVVLIMPPVAAIIEKYKDDPYCIKRGVLFPIIANANCNAYLKELAAICGIDRELNTHLARHTFAHIMLNYGVSLEVVSKMLGHRSIRTTQRYCRVSLQLIRDKVKPILSKMFTKFGKLKVTKYGAINPATTTKQEAA